MLDDLTARILNCQATIYVDFTEPAIEVGTRAGRDGIDGNPTAAAAFASDTVIEFKVALEAESRSYSSAVKLVDSPRRSPQCQPNVYLAFGFDNKAPTAAGAKSRMCPRPRPPSRGERRPVLTLQPSPGRIVTAGWRKCPGEAERAGVIRFSLILGHLGGRDIVNRHLNIL